MRAAPEKERYVIRVGESASYDADVGVGKWRVRWVTEENLAILRDRGTRSQRVSAA